MTSVAGHLLDELNGVRVYVFETDKQRDTVNVTQEKNSTGYIAHNPS